MRRTLTTLAIVALALTMVLMGPATPPTDTMTGGESMHNALLYSVYAGTTLYPSFGDVQADRVLFSDGSAAAPSIAFASEPSTGIYRLSASTWRVSVLGTPVLEVSGFPAISLIQPSGELRISTDVRLARDAANTLALRNGANAQTFKIYNKWTDASNYERAFLGFDSNVFTIRNEENGSGVARGMLITSASGSSIDIGRGGGADWRFNGNLNPLVTDSKNLGSSTKLVQHLYLSRSIQGSKSTALTDATATNFADVSIPQTGGANYAAGFIVYTIFCEDASNQAVQSGRVQFACHNLAGTESCGFGTPDGVTLGDGTASIVAPVFTATGGADLVNILVDSDCTGVTPTTLNIQHRFDMQQVNTVAPVP